jgi:uncharacterized protein YggE
MKLFSAAVLALGLAVAALFAGVGIPDAARSVAPEQTPARGITTSGTGSVETVPDEAAFSFGVESLSATAKEALAANGAEMRRVIAALREAGVDLRDIRTQQVSLYPRYSDEGRTVVGYTATNTVGAEIDRLSSAGDVVDAAVAAGANQVSGPSLSRSERGELVQDALRKAVADARAKAEALAEAAGVSLGRAVSVVEGVSAEPPVPYYERSALAADAGTPVQPGTEKIEATVTVTFALA